MSSKRLPSPVEEEITRRFRQALLPLIAGAMCVIVVTFILLQRDRVQVLTLEKHVNETAVIALDLENETKDLAAKLAIIAKHNSDEFNALKAKIDIVIAILKLRFKENPK